MLPSYILNQEGYYNQIAVEFYQKISTAKTKEQYEEMLGWICRRWRRDFTDPNVQQYFLESGEMEPEVLQEIRKWYVDHAEPFQKVLLSAGLKSGKKYTLVYINEYGFPIAQKITFKKMYPCQYAQYTDAIGMEIHEYRARHDSIHYFYNCSLAIYEGWKELKREDISECVVNNYNMQVWKSKYCAFDARYYEDAVKVLGKPIFDYRNFKIRKSDGKVFV